MNEVTRIVGRNIKFYRTQKGLTMQELANLVGYKTRGAINRIEKGDRDIPTPLINKMAQALGVSVTDILGNALNIDPFEEFKEYLPYLARASEEDLIVIRRILNMPKKGQSYGCTKKAN